MRDESSVLLMPKLTLHDAEEATPLVRSQRPERGPRATLLLYNGLYDIEHKTQSNKRGTNRKKGQHDTHTSEVMARGGGVAYSLSTHSLNALILSSSLVNTLSFPTTNSPIHLTQPPPIPFPTPCLPLFIANSSNLSSNSSCLT